MFYLLFLFFWSHVVTLFYAEYCIYFKITNHKRSDFTRPAFK